MFVLPRVSRASVGLLFLLVLSALLGMTFMMPTSVRAQSDPGLGTAASFSVLGGSAVTNTGPSIVSSDLGVSPGTAITGFPPGVVNGTLHSADAVALQAQADLTAAYNSLAGQLPCTQDLTGQDLGGLTLTSGIYCFSASAQLTGTVTLDAQGNSASVFVIKIGSTLTTASNSSVLVINGGTGCNVWWQVGSSATLGTTTAFQGNILALTSITLNTTATILPGRALARNGAVTLDTNTISNAACIAVPPTNTPVPTSTPIAAATSAPVSNVVAATFPPLPTLTLVPTTVSTALPVGGLPNTGGARPQATYWLHFSG